MNTKILNFHPESCCESFEPEPDTTQKGVQSDLQGVGYKCKYCNKHLSTKQSLREHSYIHTGEKPYECREPGCGQTFRQSSQLSYHKRIHIELKKFMSSGAEVAESASPAVKPSKKLELPDLPGLALNKCDSTLSVHIKFHPVH